jgi:serine/threonine-protein kinase
MGLVYRAVHARIACTFAVKVLFGDLAFDPEKRARFLREAEAASCLQSRHIVRVIDFGQTEAELPYLVMEFLDGPSLADVLGRGALEPTRAVRIAESVARGLSHAHARGVVHRDLKPENIALVSEDEETDIVKVLDFGVASVRGEERLTSAGVVVGTPLYMAPEQLTGRPLDGRTDLYALGVMLSEMLTGEPPFDAPTLPELSQLTLAGPPPSLAGAPRANAVPRADPRGLEGRPAAFAVAHPEIVDTPGRRVAHPGPEDWRRAVP